MTIELVRQGNYGKAMTRISSSRLAPNTEQTHRKLTDLHPPDKACRVASGHSCGLPAIVPLCFRSTNSIPNEECRSSKHRTFL
ncbi:hypothetical protein GJ496_010273 [Pomphorhynchus laevis]|nr:hypothetical protein GJ496_010273 [Pomphorhynchus laevis]